MRGNPMNSSAEKKAYGCAQYTELMNLNEFAEHIAGHGCVYSRADIAAILTMAVDCMRELLLQGQRITLGDLGVFSISLNSVGADTADAYNPSIHVKRVKVNWSCGDRFLNLLDDATFNLVPTRKAASLLVKALKAGETIVDLSGDSSSASSGASTDDTTDSESADETTNG